MKTNNSTNTNEDVSGMVNERAVAHEVHPLFPSRWSKRSMSGADVAPECLNRMFEAARWAPSSFNNQPWRFVYSRKASESFPPFLSLLDANNQIWAKDAGALIIIASLLIFEKNHKPSRTHSFDAGAAWENAALQASHMGLVCHAMEGFDYEQAYDLAGIARDRYNIEAMVAVGHPATSEKLPTNLEVLEHPSARKDIELFAFDSKLKV